MTAYSGYRDGASLRRHDASGASNNPAIVDEHLAVASSAPCLSDQSPGLHHKLSVRHVLLNSLRCLSLNVNVFNFI